MSLVDRLRSGLRPVAWSGVDADTDLPEVLRRGRQRVARRRAVAVGAVVILVGAAAVGLGAAPGDDDPERVAVGPDPTAPTTTPGPTAPPPEVCSNDLPFRVAELPAGFDRVPDRPPEAPALEVGQVSFTWSDDTRFIELRRGVVGNRLDGGEPVVVVGADAQIQTGPRVHFPYPRKAALVPCANYALRGYDVTAAELRVVAEGLRDEGRPACDGEVRLVGEVPAGVEIHRGSTPFPLVRSLAEHLTVLGRPAWLGDVDGGGAAIELYLDETGDACDFHSVVGQGMGKDELRAVAARLGIGTGGGS